jgi:hypothetical protein
MVQIFMGGDGGGEGIEKLGKKKVSRKNQFKSRAK